MNIKNLQEFNHFKKMINSNGGDPQEITAFKDIKEAESMDVSDLLTFGKQFILIGLMKEGNYSRPIVMNYEEGHEYPKPDRFALFPDMDMIQDLTDLQDVLDVVPDPVFETGAVVRPFDLKIFNLDVVYGRKRNNHPHLTLAEVVSQLAPRYETRKKFFFYICDAAEECGNLTAKGYHAYRVAVYEAAKVTDEMIPNLTIDGE